MGWFDQEKEAQKPAAPATTSTAVASAPASTPARAAAPAPTGGSVLGSKLAVNGTISSEEDLTIEGRIEGTIRSSRTLRVVEGASVKAVIHGHTVLIEGTVDGDVHAVEAVVLGATASLTGNVKTPSLNITDGAFFKGSVDMKSATVANTAAPRPTPAPRRTPRSRPLIDLSYR